MTLPLARVSLLIVGMICAGACAQTEPPAEVGKLAAPEELVAMRSNPGSIPTTRVAVDGYLDYCSINFAFHGGAKVHLNLRSQPNCKGELITDTWLTLRKFDLGALIVGPKTRNVLYIVDGKPGVITDDYKEVMLEGNRFRASGLLTRNDLGAISLQTDSVLALDAASN